MKKLLTLLLVLILLIVAPFSIACNDNPNNVEPPNFDGGGDGSQDGGSDEGGGDQDGDQDGDQGGNQGSGGQKPPMSGEGEEVDDDKGSILK